MRDLFDKASLENAPHGELGPLGLPGIAAGMSRPEILEQLAKLRERGDLTGREYLRACQDLDAR